MKKVFGAIGHFFARIWRWITETAWIQPLLIVGLIFGVVFSIPSISSWFNKMSESNGRFSYYNANTVSSKDLLSYAESGDFKDLYDNENHFLLVFIEKDCSSCITDEEAFRLFSKKDNWNYDGKQSAPSVKFVYANYDTDDDSTKAKNYRSFVETADLYDTVDTAYRNTAESGYGVTYNSSYVTPMEDALNPKVPTPLIASYVDGVMEEVIMGLEGNGDIERMKYLRDFYYHTGDFE